MIAKLVVWDEDRDAALQRLRGALADWQLAGTVTNTAFLARVAAHPAFARGGVDTGFIERYRDDLFPGRQDAVPDRLLAVAALRELLGVERAATARARASGDPWSPWHGSSGWQLNSDNFHTLHFLDGDRDVEVVAHYRPGHFLLELPGGDCRASGVLGDDDRLRVRLDGVHLDAVALREADRLIVSIGELRRELKVHDPLSAGMEDEIREGSLTAPMPGTVIAVMVEAGDEVAEGDALMVLEAMKMETTIRAFAPGVVDHVNFAVGDQVSEGAELLAISAPEA
jgi:3-methylcrotonyl-CoA carboxylase alpha subunit